MILIPKGKYKIGNDVNLGHKIDNEFPLSEVYTKGFLIDETAVTNKEFAKFVAETNYITFAEKFGSSFVFSALIEKLEDDAVPNLEWWIDVKGANWKNPFGDEKSYLDILNHPVVHVTQEDALMYCRWANKRLPTEIEWEIAAKGDSENMVFPWGNELEEGCIHRANVWQGEFPKNNTLEDGYLGTAPADAFYTNSFGIKQMIGNVWEMCSNEARIDLNQIKTETINEQIDTFYKNEFLDYAAKGGSFLCHHSYCNRYRLSARNGIDKLSSSSNKGFRCVQDI